MIGRTKKIVNPKKIIKMAAMEGASEERRGTGDSTCSDDSRRRSSQILGGEVLKFK